LIENPDTLLLPLVHADDQILELGPGLGFFTLPVARAVGERGQVVCLDIQSAMLEKLGKRLSKQGLGGRVELRQCSASDLGLASDSGRFDLALAMHVLHETPSPDAVLSALAGTLKPGGHLLMVEPPGHCPLTLWKSELDAAERTGLVRARHPVVEGRKMLALWQKMGCSTDS
jgi:ubiquinone/menaquinone biosynthesis C-methylase UbiE